MTVIKWVAAAALVLSATACGSSNNTAYRGNYAYAPGAYDYNQQPTYYETHYANGQPTYGQPTYAQPTYTRQQAYYGYGYQPQPTYYGYQQPVYYYGR
jgi:hypothetical protein